MHAEVRVVGAQMKLAVHQLVEHHVERTDLTADVEHGSSTMGVMVMVPVAHEPATDNSSTS